MNYYWRCQLTSCFRGLTLAVFGVTIIIEPLWANPSCFLTDALGKRVNLNFVCNSPKITPRVNNPATPPSSTSPTEKFNTPPQPTTADSIGLSQAVAGETLINNMTNTNTNTNTNTFQPKQPYPVRRSLQILQNP